ncbi:protein SIEL-like isoform X1 [Papaver somniferum]|nr:protein SIEL-like isoform X1 [Papaver somniferum]
MKSNSVGFDINPPNTFSYGANPLKKMGEEIWEEIQKSNLSISSIRSLIVNPSTSKHIISAVFKTLTQYLQQEQEQTLENQNQNHYLKLLCDIATHHRDFTSIVFDTVRSFAFGSSVNSQFKVESLSVLLTIAEHDENLVYAITEFDENVIIELCFDSSVSVRYWIFKNLFRFRIRDEILLRVLLGFVNDPYPYVRRISLDGLVRLSKSVVEFKNGGLIAQGYDGAVDLFVDRNDCVRAAAIGVVCEWGQMLPDSGMEVGEQDWSDSVFVQLCSMVRDMSMEVRNEAFVSLGKMKMVSEDILLQTLSKKVLGNLKERKFPGKRNAKNLDLPASNAADAFIHGLEDEFYEVRKSACYSLGMLIAFSVRFAIDALDLLMDMLNDHSTVVRLQTLETMYRVVTCDRLKVQEAHMHMFLGTLVDASNLIRHAARKVLSLLELPFMKIFKSSINGLLTNLTTYPEDEADIFSVLFYMGRNHGSFAVSFVTEVSQEIEPSCEEELRFDNPRVAAILVLAIHERLACSIPTKVFSYAIPFLGRIVISLKDCATQDALLAYLYKFSKITHVPASVEDDLFHVAGGKLPLHNIDEIFNQVLPLQQICGGASEDQFQNDMRDLRQTTFPLSHQWKVIFTDEEAEKNVNLILRTVAATWQLIKSGFTDEVQKTSRSCSKELATVAVNSNRSTGLLAFASQYVQVVQHIAEIWIHFLPLSKFHYLKTGMLDHLLEKLDYNLRKLRYEFSGLSKKEELHILELVLLACVVRLSEMEICCNVNTLKRVQSTISVIELLCEDLHIQLSEFAGELRKSLSERGYIDDGALSQQFSFKRLLDLFSLKEMVFDGMLKHIKAELGVPGNNSENPLSFVSGLPAGVTFQITLFNISDKDRLCLKMSVQEAGLFQYVFLDMNQIGGYNEINKVTLSVPFYNTPRTASFVLRACVMKECPSEDVGQRARGSGGPKWERIIISNITKIYLVAAKCTT